jgi:hypothetical protein
MPIRHAPTPVVVDGLLAVPIDILRVDAAVVFDTSTRRASATATIRFRTGEADGCPVFDLRQTVTAARLDGVSLDPVELAHHDLGGGPDAEMRVLTRTLMADTEHTLEVNYTLATPASPYAQPVSWSADGARVAWDLFFSDLRPARYLEMWFPSNLIYDAFTLSLDLRVTGTTVAHAVLANGQVSALGTNRWRVEYPAHFVSFSPMLVLDAVDRLVTRSGSIALPGGPTVALTLAHPTSLTNVDLAAVETALCGYLISKHADLGPYDHGDRFVAYLWPGTRSMEYNGATTSNVGALEHETFHSWYGRSVRPATQNDSWLDEACATWSTPASAQQAVPFDLSAPPVLLRPTHPWNRFTTPLAYSAGRDLFEGLAAVVGVPALQAILQDFYQQFRGQAVTTEDFEAFVVCASSRIDLMDAFQRFVHGHGALSGASRPDLFLRDAEGDSGVDDFTGPVFWDSPDLWVRSADDNGTAHQNPEHGQDNWLYARVCNRGTVAARTFVVTFTVRPYAGTEFIHPDDYAPCTAAVVGYDLVPGGSTVVRARWPRALVPAPGTHACLLGRVYTPDDPIRAGRHVWEHNNLAQKNLTIMDIQPDAWMELPFRIGSSLSPDPRWTRVEVVRPAGWESVAVQLTHRKPALLERLLRESRSPPTLRAMQPAAVVHLTGGGRMEVPRLGAPSLWVRLGPGSRIPLGDDPDALTPEAWSRSDLEQAGAALTLRAGKRVGFSVVLPARTQLDPVLRVQAPRGARPGQAFTLHVLQRHTSGRVMGGIAVRVNVVPPRG